MTDNTIGNCRPRSRRPLGDRSKMSMSSIGMWSTLERLTHRLNRTRESLHIALFARMNLAHRAINEHARLEPVRQKRIPSSQAIYSIRRNPLCDADGYI